MPDVTDPFTDGTSAHLDPRSMYLADQIESVPSAQELGRRLRALREREGISVSEVARRVGRSPKAISRFESEGKASAALLLELVRTMTSSRDFADAFRNPKFSSIEDVVRSSRRGSR